MSDVSFIRAAPATPEMPGRRAAAAPAADAPQEKPREKPPAPAPELSSKTRVKTEPLSPFSYGYTFIDAKTDRVIGRWPVAPPMPADAALGAHIKHSV